MARWIWRQDAEPGTPGDHMATDAALLCQVRDCATTPSVVRLYTWDRPCVSIGRLQDAAAAQAAYPDLPLVRRPTGGRAVRHGDDLTLSVVTRLGDLPHGGETSVLATYRLIAGGIVDAFCELGLPATFGDSHSRSQGGLVDCFEMVSRCDIVDRHSGRKLAGCAQRRDGAALLQQMSVPLAGIPEQARFVELIRTKFAGRLAVSVWETEGDMIFPQAGYHQSV